MDKDNKILVRARIPASLDARLHDRAKRRGITYSAIVREYMAWALAVLDNPDHYTHLAAYAEEYGCSQAAAYDELHGPEHPDNEPEQGG